jgi:hypothetical protein
MPRLLYVFCSGRTRPTCMPVGASCDSVEYPLPNLEPVRARADAGGEAVDGPSLTPSANSPRTRHGGVAHPQLAVASIMDCTRSCLLDGWLDHPLK